MTSINKHVILRKYTCFCLQNTTDSDVELRLGKLPLVFTDCIISYSYGLFI